MEALLREGPLTATQAAELLGDSPGNMSWHLQTLAKYGFVEEAGGGLGRARPWRLVAASTRFSSEGEDAQHRVAAETLEATIHERTFARLREWMTQRPYFPPEWRRSGFAHDSLTYLTADELGEVGEELKAVLDRYRSRAQDRTQRPEGSRAVHLVAFGHPLPPSPQGN
jgi:DNA-binding transcriptional ArsR family regulator